MRSQQVDEVVDRAQIAELTGRLPTLDLDVGDARARAARRRCVEKVPLEIPVLVLPVRIRGRRRQSSIGLLPSFGDARRAPAYRVQSLHDRVAALVHTEGLLDEADMVNATEDGDLSTSTGPSLCVR